MSELEELCKLHNVTLTAVDCGVHIDDNKWQHREWRVTLKMQGRTYTTTYRTGMGHAPKPADVLYCLCSDARMGQMNFTEFCSEFGYDEDSRKAENTWRACADTYRQLPSFLREHFETFCDAEH